MIYNIIYNGTKFAEVDIQFKELANYKKVLEMNLPKAIMEKKTKAVLVVKQPQ